MSMSLLGKSLLRIMGRGNREMKGADIKAVSKMLGHASVATTLNIYHHVDREEIKRVHDEHSPLNIERKEANESNFNQDD